MNAAPQQSKTTTGVFVRNVLKLDSRSPSIHATNELLDQPVESVRLFEVVRWRAGDYLHSGMGTRSTSSLKVDRGDEILITDDHRRPDSVETRVRWSASLPPRRLCDRRPDRSGHGLDDFPADFRVGGLRINVTRPAMAGGSRLPGDRS
jgi:hypothetical protein